MPFGAACLDDGSVRFRIWAPRSRQVEVSVTKKKKVLSLSPQAAEPEGTEGWFELITREAAPGSCYQFLIDGQHKVPDPASRFQPEDVHGPSQVIDPASFAWQDDQWLGRPWEEAVIYELHVGTFTRQGTFAAAEEKLDYLAKLGVTAVELMPVADFPGARNWGYDGVLPYAPDSTYGRPEDLKHFIQAAHAQGLMVLLDVVYNHLGPQGNYFGVYAPQFFTDRYHTPWGQAINYDGPGSRVVRDFFIHNALYWLEEYNFDGLRLDAVHAIFDRSNPDILTELVQCVRQQFGPGRLIHLVLENDNNAAHYLDRDEKGRARLYDAQWNDDIHHAFHVLITGETDGYYCDYAEHPLCHLGRSLAGGFSYQGQASAHREGAHRGESSRHLPPTAFVSFLQNHDQVGNRAFGDRMAQFAEPRALHAALAVLLLAPSPPLLFMGEEFGADTPFLFFCNFGPDLAGKVTEGRRNEFARFAKFRSPEMRAPIPDPGLEDTFLRSKLDWNSVGQAKHDEWLNLYRQLLALRQQEIVPHVESGSRSAKYEIHAVTVLTANWKFCDGADLTLIANLSSTEATFSSAPAGRMIYAGNSSLHSELETKTMPAWSVAWYLQP